MYEAVKTFFKTGDYKNLHMKKTSQIRQNRIGAVDSVIGNLHLRSERLENEWQKLRYGIERLDQQRQVLQEEKTLYNEAIIKQEYERSIFEEKVIAEWYKPTPIDEARTTRIRLNIGGQLFETTTSILARDRFSLLAAVCSFFNPLLFLFISENSNLKQDEDGAYFFDRDWWVFRYILSFLRDGKLPEKLELLQAIYEEASYYRLGLLRYAIATKLNLPKLSKTRRNQQEVNPSIATTNSMVGAKSSGTEEKIGLPSRDKLYLDRYHEVNQSFRELYNSPPKKSFSYNHIDDSESINMNKFNHSYTAGNTGNNSLFNSNTLGGVTSRTNLNYQSISPLTTVSNHLDESVSPNLFYNNANNYKNSSIHTSRNVGSRDDTSNQTPGIGPLPDPFGFTSQFSTNF